MSETLRDTYGARFLREYAAVRALEGADREEFGRVLRREMTGLPNAVNQMIESDEPEALARWFAHELQNKAANSTIPAFFF